MKSFSKIFSQGAAAFILGLILVIGVSCGKKEATQNANLNPNEIEVSYENGRPIISWQTDEPTHGSVFFGAQSGDYDHFAYEAEGLTRNHSIKIISADSAVNYVFVVRSNNKDGLESFSSERTFRPQSATGGDLLEWTMLDIAQGVAIGDCHFIRTPSGYKVIIDSGDGDKVNSIFAFCSNRNLDHFNLAVLTHLHSDHYGGFTNGIFENYSIDSLMLAQRHESSYDGAYGNVASSAEANGIGVGVIKEGDTLNWDPEITVTALHSGSIGDGNENNSSIVLKITYGEIDLILSGDAEIPSESMMIDHFSSAELDCEILKIAHHGRYDANSDEWFEITSPDVALISVDQETSWGGNSLPSESVVSRLFDLGIDTYRSDRNYPNGATYRHGNVTLLTDGVSYDIIIN
ncbi:MAG: hypothetical protein CO189_03425 [candidate division Zixibacteria bacterium CG_4_9_14_3_um_filter_46_8]|nr:MAG: hypothetical protein CO189_03425 [candidate division Zixibacteria bacterium CG_4_9_14_3_um_filter_46_8]